MDLTALRNRITIKVNDRITADYVDNDRLYTRGCISLQTVGKMRDSDSETVVEFRKIEIKELNETGERTASIDRDPSVPLLNSDEPTRPTQATLDGRVRGGRN